MIITAEFAQKIERLLPVYLEKVKSPEYDEEYKWKALIHFQKTFDLEAEDFAGMLSEALPQKINSC